MSGPPRSETLNRLTDIVVDKVASRLGTSGTDLADDLVTRIDQGLGLPVEISAQSPASQLVNVGSSVYTLPSGARVAVVDEAARVVIAAGTINFHLGQISSGANASFALPSLTAGQYIIALIQLKKDSGSLNVSFGSASSTLAGAGAPAVLSGYEPVCQVELHSTFGGTGVFDNITTANLVYLLGGLRSARGPVTETQTVSASSQTLFTLASVTVPVNRSKLSVWQNGIRLFSADYSVPSDNTVSLVEAAPQNAQMTFEVRN